MSHLETQSFQQLKVQLHKMFQLDRGDLDFGVYRIMNKKRAEIAKFLDDQLLPQVREVLNEYQPTSDAATHDELKRLIAGLSDAGVDPESSPKVKQLRSKLAASIDLNKVENEIYSDLHNFFSRYYLDGDFMSLRRYKEGVYAMPYEGEEVKLHWANKDQYYIKTSESFKNYTFKTGIGRKRVRFQIVAAGAEEANNIAPRGKERKFILHSDEPLECVEDDLTIRFEYRYDEAGRKQEDINKDILSFIIRSPAAEEFGLEGLDPEENGPGRTLIEKHLSRFTAKNNFDYFIHKDLGKFLRRELDFFIKNEVIHLDDIEDELSPRVESYLAKVKSMRKVGLKIIQFLAQLEDFQKKLWLKKKFILNTHYCVTLSHIVASDMADELLPIVASNFAQNEEWRALNSIGNEPVTVEFLRANDGLLVDTKFFDTGFKYKLLSMFSNLDEQTNGILINSENFQALNFLNERYKGKVKCVYIDPPYNTGSDTDFLYRDAFQHSSWLTMMDNRLSLMKALLSHDASFYCQLDYNESARFKLLADDKLNFHREIIWSNESSSGFKAQANTWIRGHDTIYFYSKTGCPDFEKQHLPLAAATMRRYDKVDPDTGEKYKEYTNEDGSIRKVFLRDSEGKPISTVWTDLIGFQTNNAGREHIAFSTQKPTSLISRIIKSSSRDSNFHVLDFFAGSGTTGHSVVKLNREDGGCRKYILVEMGTYFDTITLPRMKKAVYSEGKNGKQGATNGVGHLMKYLTLESYDDSLDNLCLSQSEVRHSLLASSAALNEQYMLGYMLDIESRGSSSLLNVNAFDDPFSYTLRVSRQDQTDVVAVDLVETFNYLLGMVVRAIRRDASGIVIVTGKNALGEECLVVWRNVKDIGNDDLDAWFRNHQLPVRFDVVYVNGDNNIENMKSAGDQWKVRLIESEFKRLMFEMQANMG